MQATVRKGFTLIEILIVVIILGILAAIVIPQFTNASKDAKKSAAQSSEQTIRSQISLFKLEHNDNLPTLADLQDGWKKLLTKTDVTGTAAGNYGPYLPAAPKNPYNGSITVKAVANLDATSQQPASTEFNDSTVGWIYDAGTGRVWATTGAN